MVEKVERLERETASWREIVEWPVFDDKFRPNNDTMLIDESKTYLGRYLYIIIAIVECVRKSVQDTGIIHVIRKKHHRLFSHIDAVFPLSLHNGPAHFNN